MPMLKKKGKGKGAKARTSNTCTPTASAESTESTVLQTMLDPQSESDGETMVGRETESDIPQGAPKTKRTKREKTFITDEEEDDAIEWVKGHPCLYNKGCREFRDAQKRSRLWKEKAADLEMNEQDLVVWWKSIRTRYGKISATKSGDGARVLTDRDAFISDRLKFLETHIKRIVGRQTSALKPQPSSAFTVPCVPVDSTAISASVSAAPTSDGTGRGSLFGPDEEPPEDGTDDLDQHVTPSRPVHTPTLHIDRPVAPQPGKRQRRTTSVESRETEDIMVQLMREGNCETRKALQRIDEAIAQCNAQPNSRRSWGQWMTSRMEAIDESLWDEFQDTTYDVMRKFLTRSNEVKEAKEERANEAKLAEVQRQELMKQQQVQNVPQYVIQYMAASTPQDNQPQLAASGQYTVITTDVITTQATAPQPNASNMSLSDLGNLSFMPGMSTPMLAGSIVTPTALLDTPGCSSSTI